MNKYALGLFFVIASLYSAMVFLPYFSFTLYLLLLPPEPEATDVHALVITLVKKKKSPKHTGFGRFPCTLNSSLEDHLFPMNFESVLGDSFSRFEFGMQMNRAELL